MLPSMQEDILTDKHIKLLDRFERDVAIYDRLAEFSVVMSSIGIICSILIPLTACSFLIRSNPFDGVTGSPYIYFVVAGMVVTVLMTRLLIIYADRKKHKISETEYRPVTGFCMCDFSMLRSHTKKLECAKTMGERLRHAKLVNYYTEQIMRQRTPQINQT